MKIFYLILLFCLTGSFTYAQTSQISIGSPSINEVFYELKTDPTDSSTISVGSREDQSTGTGIDCFMVKMDAQHQIVWQKVIPNTGNDLFYQVIVCANGDYVAAGYRSVNGSQRGYVCRISSTNGNIIWSSSSSLTNAPFGDYFYSLVETTSQNIAIVGNNNNAGTAAANGFVVLLNSSGTALWSVISSYGNADETRTIVQLPSGNLLVGAQLFNGSGYEASIMEFSEASGAVVNQNIYSINTSLPGVGLSLNSIWPVKCYVKNNTVLFYILIFQGSTSNSYEGIYTLDLSTRSLTGNIYYHPGLNNNTIFAFYPISSTDFLVAESYSGPTTVVVSRVSSGSIVYDRQMNSQVGILYGISGLNANVAFAGNTISNPILDAYNLFSSTSFPATTTPCNITDLNSLALQPSVLLPTISNTLIFSASPAMAMLPSVANPTNYSVNSICGCVAAVIGTQPSNATVCANGSTSFSVNATNATAYQWQVHTGSGWNDIVNNGTYSGVMTNTLNLTGVTLAMNNYQCRVKVSGTCGIITSMIVTLTVSPLSFDFNTSLMPVALLRFSLKV